MGHGERNKDELISYVFSIDVLGLVDLQELIIFISVRTYDVVWKTCKERCRIETAEERESPGNPCDQCNLIIVMTYIHIYIYTYLKIENMFFVDNILKGAIVHLFVHR